MITKLTKLNPVNFKHDNYEFNWWTIMHMSFEDSMDTNKLITAINKYAIGYCDGHKVSSKPRNKSYAVMFNVEGYEFWFHIEHFENDLLNDYIEMNE